MNRLQAFGRLKAFPGNRRLPYQTHAPTSWTESSENGRNSRRCRELHIATALAALLLFADGPLFAQPLFDRLLIVAPAAPGGGWDQTARAMQSVLEADGLVRVVEVQNVAGAAGTIGLAQFVDTRRGDGHALLVSGLVMLGATLWNDSPVSLDQTTPIARLTGEYEVVVVQSSSTHRDIQSLIEALRRQPGAVSWAGGSAGGTDHILAGLIALSAGVDPRRVNYIAYSGGGEAAASLLGGNMTAGISGYSEFAPHIASGRLRALAISSPARIQGIDAPSLKERGLDVDLVNWRAVVAPPGITTDDRARLMTLVSRLSQSPRWKQTLSARAWTDMYLDGEDFEDYLVEERSRLARIVGRLRTVGWTERIPLGRRIFPAAVYTGAAVVLVTVLWRHRRGRRLASDAPARVFTNYRALAVMSLGLTLFLVLSEPLGFVIAATALFACASSALAPAAARPVMIGAFLSILLYLAFTRGLDLVLPSGSLWPWTR